MMLMAVIHSRSCKYLKLLCLKRGTFSSADPFHFIRCFGSVCLSWIASLTLNVSPQSLFLLWISLLPLKGVRNKTKKKKTLIECQLWFEGFLWFYFCLNQHTLCSVSFHSGTESVLYLHLSVQFIQKQNLLCLLYSTSQNNVAGCVFLYLDWSCETN